MSALLQLTKTIILSSGFKLGLAISGRTNGNPIVFFHGLGASRQAVHPDASLADALNARIIAFDRPGIGLSDKRNYYSLQDFADMVAEALVLLNIKEKVSVLGWSGGGPYALAFAQRYPQLVRNVGLANSSIPFYGPGVKKILPKNWKLIRWFNNYTPWLSRLFFRNIFSKVKKAPEKLIARAIENLPAPDRTLLFLNPKLATMFQQATLDVYAQGAEGIYRDARTISGPWGFHLEDITVPTYQWHGSLDKLWPLATAYFLDERLPHNTLKIFKNEAHLLYLNHWQEIIKTLQC
ncbi:alpha/beta fold hydrolase [Adhaeribacter rhizoryzae]|uniref:Alpha/beta hydrolase n=1 Tax=Adhaeribacter rhizoryzae TaxID=2607907 RepID=A0A5M6D950_9BACT|nr:alpha/beta hydrolase [Adhaeribacter rhizoryzae]KAA5544068.1 alpha/beta hydrolase [Adhaeribacter rhizoryzae]